MSRLKSQIEYVRDNETGGFNSIFMLFCIIAIGSYLKGGRALLEQLNPAYHLGIVAVIGVVTIFTLGCQLHVLLLGEKSPGQIRRELDRQSRKLANFIKLSRDRIAEIEQKVEFSAGLLRPIAYDNITHSRQLLDGLERRVRQVHSLTTSKKQRNIYEAAALMGAPLSPFDNCMDSLIDARPLPPLESDQWIPTVEQLLSSIEFEAARAASRQQAAA